MESIDLEMDDLFDTEAGDDDDIGAHHGATLPELDEDGDGPMRLAEDGENQEGQDDEDGVVANLQRLSKGAAKKKVMRPQPKLDVERLKSERGLADLPKIFGNVKFKGHGQEADDLKMVMNKLEHWAHRLFPQATFDQFIERMEKLGAKKPVQTCIKRVRLDMPLLDTDFVSQYEEVGPPPDDDGPINTNVDDEAPDMDAEEAFEEMIRQERATQQQTPHRAQAFISSDDEDTMGNDSQAMKTPSKERSSNIAATSTPNKTPATPKASQPPVQNQGMTPDVKARIEANKRKALEKRAARLGVSVQSLMPQQPSASQSANGNTTIGSKTSTNGSQVTQSQHSQSNSMVNTDTQPILSSDTAGQIKFSTDNESHSDGLSKELSRPGLETENDMQTEDELLNALGSDNEEETTGGKPKNNLMKKTANSMEIKDSEALFEQQDIIKLNNKDILESMDLKESEPMNLQLDLSDKLNSKDDLESMDLKESEPMNLQLDLSLTETMDNPDTEHLNLQLDLSVSDGQGSDMKSPEPNGQKITQTMDVDSESMSIL